MTPNNDDALVEAGLNVGHGWVKPRPDGARAHCGGPALCMSCQAEALMLRPALTAHRNYKGE